MKYLFCFLLIINSICFAQIIEDKAAFSMSIVGLTNHEDIAPLVGFYYQKGITKHLLVGVKTGIMWYAGKDNEINQITELRRRVTLDLEAKIVALKYKNNYLKIGIGPSIWYRNDKLVTNLKYYTPPNQKIVTDSYQYKFTKGLQLGYTTNVELEMKIFKALNISYGFGFNKFLNGEINYIGTLNVYLKSFR